MITTQLNQVALTRDTFTLSIDALTLEQGRTYAILGPNGSGKSSLLDVLALMAVPTHGQVLFRDQPIHHPDRRAVTLMRRRIAYLMQDPYLFDDTVLGNVMLPLTLRHLPADTVRDKTATLLALLGLEALRDRHVRTLSGGEAQRTALARTLATEADLILLDEPTANVDRAHVERVEGAVIQRAREHRATVVITTHSETQASRIAESLIRLDNGRITSVNTTSDKDPA